jgi:hypothetical protein
MAVTRGLVVARVFFRRWLCPDLYHGFFVARFCGWWLAMVVEGGGAAAGFCFIKVRVFSLGSVQVVCGGGFFTMVMVR